MNYPPSYSSAVIESNVDPASPNPIRESLNSLAECLGAKSWITASVSLENPAIAPEELLTSIPYGGNFSSNREPEPTELHLLFEALSAEAAERELWKRSQLERRHFYATYDWKKERNILLSFYATSDGLLRGILFSSPAPFSEENVQVFRSLFDSVAVGEGNKDFLKES